MAHMVKALAAKSEDVSPIPGHHLIEGERDNSAGCPLTPTDTKQTNSCDKSFKGSADEMVQLIGVLAPKPGPEFEHQSPHRGERELTPAG